MSFRLKKERLSLYLAPRVSQHWDRRGISEYLAKQTSLRYLFEKVAQIFCCKSKKNLNIEKIIFKVVQMKFLAMHITNQKLSFDIFTVGNLHNIFMEHDLNILMIFGIK